MIKPCSWLETCNIWTFTSKLNWIKMAKSQHEFEHIRMVIVAWIHVCGLQWTCIQKCRWSFGQSLGWKCSVSSVRKGRLNNGVVIMVFTHLHKNICLRKQYDFSCFRLSENRLFFSRFGFLCWCAVHQEFHFDNQLERLPQAWTVCSSRQSYSFCLLFSVSTIHFRWGTTHKNPQKNTNKRSKIYGS